MANLLQKYGQKLGVKDQATLKRAEEYLRIYQSKGGIKTVTELARIVFCLDLAASNSQLQVDKLTALKLSGLRSKQAYLNQLHMVKKLLSLDKNLTISELCVQLSCTSIKPLAEDILEKYKHRDTKFQDFNHPQYVAGAVNAACKLKGVKIDKSHCILASRLKTSQWKELESEFTKFVNTLGLEESQKKKKSDKSKNREDSDNDTSETEQEEKSNSDDEVEAEEDYESWKKRILKESYRALNLENEIIE